MWDQEKASKPECMGCNEMTMSKPWVLDWLLAHDGTETSLMHFIVPNDY